MFKKIIIYVALVFLLSTSYYPLTTNSHALELQSPRYQMEVQEIDLNLKQQSSFYTIESRFGHNWQDFFEVQGYIVKRAPNSLEVGLSQNLIQLGEIKPTKGSTNTTSLSLLASPQKGYQAYIIQLYPLKNAKGDIISASDCGDNSQKCNISLAKAWISNTAYGFGYNQSGPNSPSDFKNSTYFRPLPNENRGDFPNLLFSSPSEKGIDQTTITFKVNASRFLAGTFETVVNFIVLPNY